MLGKLLTSGCRKNTTKSKTCLRYGQKNIRRTFKKLVMSFSQNSCGVVTKCSRHAQNVSRDISREMTRKLIAKQ